MARETVHYTPKHQNTFESCSKFYKVAQLDESYENLPKYIIHLVSVWYSPMILLMVERSHYHNKSFDHPKLYG